MLKPQNRYIANRDVFVDALEKLNEALKLSHEFEEQYKKKYGSDLGEDYQDFNNLRDLYNDVEVTGALKAFRDIILPPIVGYAKDKEEQFKDIKEFESKLESLLKEFNDEKTSEELARAIEFYRANPAYAEAVMDSAKSS